MSLHENLRRHGLVPALAFGSRSISDALIRAATPQSKCRVCRIEAPARPASLELEREFLLGGSEPVGGVRVWAPLVAEAGSCDPPPPG